MILTSMSVTSLLLLLLAIAMGLLVMRGTELGTVLVMGLGLAMVLLGLGLGTGMAMGLLHVYSESGARANYGSVLSQVREEGMAVVTWRMERVASGAIRGRRMMTGGGLGGGGLGVWSLLVYLPFLRLHHLLLGMGRRRGGMVLRN
jgi:hypothetical protein